ncbi:MAG TPA: MotA/TolQ/ExbB proton channel family protein [Candidatus Cloacimonadota bacterium]|nr:MotA/TolQ/ExbB proton channel family protein [Candidatus Cloacimonadota bacterium]HQL14371.1 MotA/TolQ/ExbB proton channel family protein [Candidatus Cloacimonadota bacterium]
MKLKCIILIVICLMLSITLFSQTTAAPNTHLTIGEIIKDSGFWGYMIILTFAVGLVLAAVRYHQLYHKEKIDAGKYYLKLKGYIKNDDLEEATKISESFKNTTLGFIFWSGLKVFKEMKSSGVKGQELRDSVQNAFDEAVLQTVHKLDGGLFWFDVLAQTCTYLGLLGTIWGLLIAFKALSTAATSEVNRKLTEGIKVAIGTTAMGLMAAVPLTLIKGALLARAQSLIADIDEYEVKIINQINTSIKD